MLATPPTTMKVIIASDTTIGCKATGAAVAVHAIWSCAVAPRGATVVAHRLAEGPLMCLRSSSPRTSDTFGVPVRGQRGQGFIWMTRVGYVGAPPNGHVRSSIGRWVRAVESTRWAHRPTTRARSCQGACVGAAQFLNTAPDLDDPHCEIRGAAAARFVHTRACPDP